MVQEPTPTSQPPARVCKSCGCNSPLPARARLNMVYCSARCRAFEYDDSITNLLQPVHTLADSAARDEDGNITALIKHP